MPTKPEPKPESEPEPRKKGPLSVPYEPTEIIPPGADDDDEGEEEDEDHAEGDKGDDA